MTIAASADRLAEPLPYSQDSILTARGIEMWPAGTILRLCQPEALDDDGDLRPNAPFELVVVLDARSPWRLHVARGQFGTLARSYPAGAFVDSVADTVMSRDRPIYRGFEDI